MCMYSGTLKDTPENTRSIGHWLRFQSCGLQTRNEDASTHSDSYPKDPTIHVLLNAHCMYLYLSCLQYHMYVMESTCWTCGTWSPQWWWQTSALCPEEDQWARSGSTPPPTKTLTFLRSPFPSILPSKVLSRRLVMVVVNQLLRTSVDLWETLLS